MVEIKVSFCKSCRIYFREYCNCTSVHGFRYFGEKGRSTFERIWWFFIFLICLLGCISTIYRVYRKWEKSPVIVNFANKATPIYTIPFPAVTICPEAKFTQDIFNYTEILHKKEDNKTLTPLEHNQFEYMSLLCDYYPSDIKHNRNDTFSEDFFKFLNTVTPEFYFTNCTYMSMRFPCRRLFTQIVTDDGICYSFNILNGIELFRENVIINNDTTYYNETENRSQNWSIERGYEKTNNNSFWYPSRAYLAGAKNGLSLNIITPNKDLDYACNGPLQGYKVAIHAPMNLPRLTQSYFRIPLNQNVIGAVQPIVITTSSSIEKYDPKRRGCYFQEERYLKYFRNYTLTNCKLECLTNYTLYSCKCVNFFMPRENGTLICGTANIDCMAQAEKTMNSLDLLLKLKIQKIEDPSKDFKLNCDCLPICSHLDYEIETSQSDLEWKKWMKARRHLPYDNESHMSSLTIFFKSDNFITSERNELYGPIDFLANFGGLLGLFTGFSVLSLMEILYFLSVRIMFNRRLYGRWAGAKTE